MFAAILLCSTLTSRRLQRAMTSLEGGHVMGVARRRLFSTVDDLMSSSRSRCWRSLARTSCDHVQSLVVSVGHTWPVCACVRTSC